MENIKQIEIKNFKSIKHLKIDGCKRINVFVGYPNAGKSNILEALGLFGLDSKGFLLKNFVRYKDYADLFYEGNFNKEVAMVNINKVVVGLAYSGGLEMFRNNSENSNYVNFQIDKKGFGFDKKELNKYLNLSAFESGIKKYSFSDRRNNLKSDLSYLKYPFGENLAQIIASNGKLRNEVNEIFNQNYLKLLIDKGTNELRIFKEYQDGTVFTLPYEMIADTLQRLIFYKAAIMSNENSVLLFEEPEAHCFEPYILEFTNGVKYDKNKNQFFIVTHSDFIIQEFLRDKESNEDTNIYLINNVKGETKVKLLSKEKNENVYELGMNPFFNFENLWETN